MGSIISPVTPGIDISTPENASPKKKAFRLLPANDASRQDWGIISDSLKLPAHAQPTPGSTPKEAAGQMKALLEKVVGRDEDFDALIMKCSGDRIAGALQGSPAFSRDMLLPYLSEPAVESEFQGEQDGKQERPGTLDERYHSSVGSGKGRNSCVYSIECRAHPPARLAEGMPNAASRTRFSTGA